MFVCLNVACRTGRKRRCGWLDLPQLRYSNLLNGFSSLNLTKLDVLDDLETIKVCVDYSLDGQLVRPGGMPARVEDLARVKPVYKGTLGMCESDLFARFMSADVSFCALWLCWFGAVLPGWKQSTKNITSFGDLPAATKEYIAFIERSVGVHVQWVGVGAGRDKLIYQP